MAATASGALASSASSMGFVSVAQFMHEQAERVNNKIGGLAQDIHVRGRSCTIRDKSGASAKKKTKRAFYILQQGVPFVITWVNSNNDKKFMVLMHDVVIAVIYKGRWYVFGLHIVRDDVSEDMRSKHQGLLSGTITWPGADAFDGYIEFYLATQLDDGTYVKSAASGLPGWATEDLGKQSKELGIGIKDGPEIFGFSKAGFCRSLAASNELYASLLGDKKNCQFPKAISRIGDGQSDDSSTREAAAMEEESKADDDDDGELGEELGEELEDGQGSIEDLGSLEASMLGPPSVGSPQGSVTGLVSASTSPDSMTELSGLFDHLTSSR